MSAAEAEGPVPHSPGPEFSALVRRAVGPRTTRTLLSIAGVATCSLLVLVLFAAFRNPVVSVSTYLARPDIDLWVTPLGTDNLVRTAGFLPAIVAEDIATLPDVARADPLVRVFVRAEPLRPRPRAGEPSLMLLAMGYRVPDGLAAPPAFASGRAPRGGDEVALDRAAAYRLGLVLGDTLVVNGRLAAIVGLTRSTNLLITQLVFFDAEAVAEASGLEDMVSFVAVRARSGKIESVARQIRDAFPGTLVMTADAFLDNSLREMANGYVPVLSLVTLLGVVAASVLIALLVQGLVEDRRADIAVLLAMGIGTRRIATALVLVAMRLVAIGAMLGLAISLLLEVVLDRAVPTVHLAFLPADVALAFAAFALAGIVGALVPVQRLQRVDPLEAFHT